MKDLGSFLMFFTWLLFSCANQAPLSGKIDFKEPTLWRDYVYLIDPVHFDGVGASYLGEVIDSARIDQKGAFKFSRLPDTQEPILLQLCVQKKEELYRSALENENIPQSNYFPLIWANGYSIDISASGDYFQKTLTIENPGSQNEAMLALRDIRQGAFHRYLSGKMTNEHDATDIIEKEKAHRNFQKELMQFADETTYLLPALTAIRWISPDANYERIPEFVFGQCEKWKRKYPEQPMALQLCQHASRESLPLMIGDMIPDFPMPMLNGDTLALSSLLGDKLTILDLWASWCIPCRRENQDNLVPLWDKDHEQGLQIIGYALDASFAVWNKAIRKDGADRWLHASHLQGDDAPLFDALRIVTIPANFILDGQGRVVAKNLHGKELKEFVNRYLSNY